MAPIPSDGPDGATSLESSKTRTYYRRPWLDRWTGHYTLEWEGPNGMERQTVHNRLVDLDGRWPAWYSLVRLPQTLWTYAQSKRRKILRVPYPFLAWNAIRELDRLLKPGMRVLEVGGGNSTLWMAKRGVHLLTLEPDPEWAAALQKALPDSTNPANPNPANPDLANIVECLAGTAALERIANLGENSIDLAIVDPKAQAIPRVAAMRAAHSKLKPGGWLVLDNSDHPNNRSALQEFGPPKFVLTGYGAMCLVVTQTAFWQISSAPTQAS